VWSSEIEKFPLAVTAKHFPNTKQLGDITKIDGSKIDPVNIVTMGSPCQDLSIAGKREGLDGERSGLFRTAIDIIRAMRRATGGKFPQIVVWENVPGAFSSHHGADFQAVLEEITEANISMPESGRWAASGMVRSPECEVAWRVLDAQYWGVPCRRKRIFLVTDFTGERAAKILFDGKGNKRIVTARRGKRDNLPMLKCQGGGINRDRLSHCIYDGKGIRQFTPLERERLHGLPDKWTEGGSDTARFNALGNGMAQPCADFVIRRITEALRKGDW
jgi:DNA (cytosine-5)-methyltransferase 1